MPTVTTQRKTKKITGWDWRLFPLVCVGFYWRKSAFHYHHFVIYLFFCVSQDILSDEERLAGAARNLTHVGDANVPVVLNIIGNEYFQLFWCRWQWKTYWRSNCTLLCSASLYWDVKSELRNNFPPCCVEWWCWCCFVNVWIRFVFLYIAYICIPLFLQVLRVPRVRTTRQLSPVFCLRPSMVTAKASLTPACATRPAGESARTRRRWELS